MKFSDYKKPAKIYVCKDCAQLYMGKYWKANDISNLITNLEFQEEFEKDLFESI